MNYFSSPAALIAGDMALAGVSLAASTLYPPIAPVVGVAQEVTSLAIKTYVTVSMMRQIRDGVLGLLNAPNLPPLPRRGRLNDNFRPVERVGNLPRHRVYRQANAHDRVQFYRPERSRYEKCKEITSRVVANLSAVMAGLATQEVLGVCRSASSLASRAVAFGRSLLPF